MRRIRQEWLDKFKAEDEELDQKDLEAKYNSLENWFKAKAKSG